MGFWMSWYSKVTVGSPLFMRKGARQTLSVEAAMMAVSLCCPERGSLGAANLLTMLTMRVL